MMVGLAETAVIATPLALMIASAVAVERRRERRRRAALNRALHELRRPLHFLVLLRTAPARAPERTRAGAWGQLDAALDALADLEAEVNGGRSPLARRRLRADELVGGALERWRWPAALLGRQLELRRPAGGAAVLGDAAALARALDNLIANSLEHGASGVCLEARVESERLRIVVADARGPDGEGAASLAGPLAPRPSRGSDPRRGHGLAIVARIASAHGGRLALAREGQGMRAVLDLPLAPGTAPAGRRERRPALAA